MMEKKFLDTFASLLLTKWEHMHPTPTPAQRFATLINLMIQAILAQGFRGLLAIPQILQIQRELKTFLEEFEKLAADIQAGRYAPPPHRQPPARQHSPAAPPSSPRRRPRRKALSEPKPFRARPSPLRPPNAAGKQTPHPEKSLAPVAALARP